MLKKTAMIAAAAALVAVGAVVATGGAGEVAACDGKTTSASVQASACTKTASAAKVSAATAGTSCSKTKTASTAAACSETAKAACCANMAKQAHYVQVKKTADNIPYRVNTRVVMSGTYVCGSCDLQATDKCQAFLKTADGLYPLAHNKNVKSMYKMHKSGEKDFEITARVTKAGGAKYLDVTYYTAM